VTDSTIVLAWIAAIPTRWKTFIANRVVDIQENISVAMWRHIPSDDSSADLISRGLNPKVLIHNRLWWNGPSWLQESLLLWLMTSMLPVSEYLPEQRKMKKSFVVYNDQDDITQRFSKLSQL
jgi:hypothetical protein